MLSQVKQIQAESVSADEDLLGFFFANQQRIDGIIQDEGVKGDMSEFIKKFEKIEGNIYEQLNGEMKSAISQLDKVFKESFSEYITTDESQKVSLLDNKNDKNEKSSF